MSLSTNSGESPYQRWYMYMYLGIVESNTLVHCQLTKPNTQFSFTNDGGKLAACSVLWQDDLKASTG